MEHEKTTNLLGNISDKVPNFIIKKLIKVYDQLVMLLTVINQANK